MLLLSAPTNFVSSAFLNGPKSITVAHFAKPNLLLSEKSLWVSFPFPAFSPTCVSFSAILLSFSRQFFFSCPLQPSATEDIPVQDKDQQVVYDDVDLEGLFDESDELSNSQELDEQGEVYAENSTRKRRIEEHQREREKREKRAERNNKHNTNSVSYTHLTLPTICSV
eukprot:TRINITY_DN3304_c0_g6_i2.p2 TRINITY_DN3304_c0_g6~~TRINITY_DN3304_c0_g6_i2.p2  ORF type:complete len:168 (-),score=25.23 TRINITY_DN3304_c0_g6_i2:15-518(-)